MMKKKWFICATVLVIAGCLIVAGTIIAMNFDFSKLSTLKYENNVYNITDEFSDITVITDTADIEFKPSGNKDAKVVCYEESEFKHTVAVIDGKLTIKSDESKKWYDHIGFNFDSAEIIVFLPEREYASLTVEVSTGDVNIKDITAHTLDIALSTGDCLIKNVNCRSFISKANSGDLNMSNVISSGNFEVVRSTGDIELDGCDAKELNIKTSTGDVNGLLLTNKRFITETSTGDIDVPKSVKGGRCKIVTSTGDIEISVKKGQD